VARGGELARPDSGHPDGAATDDVLAALFRAHGLSLVRMALMLTGDQATAEDVVQDAFLRFHRAMPRLRDQDKALSYLRTSVLNGCRSVHRARKRALLRRFEHAVIAEHDRREVLAAVARLPVRAREVLALRYYLDLPYEEIAATLGITKGTVSSTISRALAALSRDLREDFP
jgi:RNA polymerase sigma-70 factor (sigma-E family)